MVSALTELNLVGQIQRLDTSHVFQWMVEHERAFTAADALQYASTWTVHTSGHELKHQASRVMRAFGQIRSSSSICFHHMRDASQHVCNIVLLASSRCGGVRSWHRNGTACIDCESTSMKLQHKCQSGAPKDHWRLSVGCVPVSWLRVALHRCALPSVGSMRKFKE